MARHALRSLALLPAALLLASPAAAAATAAPSTSVVTMLLPGFDTQAILASVISVDPTATAYFAACPPGEDANDCGLGGGVTIKEGPSVFEMHMTEEGEFSGDVSCAIKSDTAICTSSFSEASAFATADGASAIASTDTGPETVTDLGQYSIPVTITAGLEKLKAASGAAASATGSATGSASGSGASAASTATSASGAATGAAASSSTSSAGVPRATQNALMAGVVAAVGGVMAI